MRGHKSNRYCWLIFLVFAFFGCEEWKETAVASRESQLPQFEILGEAYQSYVVGELIEYNDLGAKAFSDDETLTVFYSGEVEVDEVGLYTITYFATNSDGLISSAERLVAITYSDVSENDLSGKYEGANFGALLEMNLSKINEKGFYESNDIMGYQGAEMRGKIVDLGNHELVLVHGEGDFGRFDDFRGEYTLSSLFWSVKLLDAPYNGLEVPIAWQRVRK